MYITGRSKISNGADAAVSAPVEETPEESSLRQLREDLQRRGDLIGTEGVGRYCACDASNDSIITTMYDTGLSSMGYLDDVNTEEDIDNTFGEAACNDAVLMKHNEVFHSEAAIPSAYSFFQEDGTVIRYITEFHFLTPSGDEMAPLDQLGRSHTNLWLLGKLMPVSKVFDSNELVFSLHPTIYDVSSSQGSQRVKKIKKSKTVSVKARVVDLFINNGSQLTCSPYLYVISENDIYYRLNKPAGRYMDKFSRCLSLFDMCTRITKEFQNNRNRRLSDISREMGLSETEQVTTWGDPMQIPGFLEAHMDNSIEVIYSECLYQHVFQDRYNSPVEANVSVKIEDNGLSGSNSPVTLNGDIKDTQSNGIHTDEGSEIVNGYTTTHKDKDVTDNYNHATALEKGNDCGDKTNANDGEDVSGGIGMLLWDALNLMREKRPFFFLDESFAAPEYLTSNQLTEKYIDRFILDEEVKKIVKKVRKPTQSKRETSKRPAPVQETQPAEPVEIKSKVSGRVIKRNSKLTDGDDLLPRQAAEDSKASSKKLAVEPPPDEGLQKKHQRLVEMEKQCNSLTLPDDFDYTSYNTASELSSDEAQSQQLLLLNDCQIDLKDARYYPRDIPLRMLKIYGADHLLDICNTCRQFSANPAGSEPLLPRFSFVELEKNILYGTSVDVYKVQEPHAYEFNGPDCLCTFFRTFNEWFNSIATANQKIDVMFNGLLKPLTYYNGVEGFEYHLKLINDSFDLSDKRKELQTRNIKVGMADAETLDHFLRTNGGCLYRGRYRHTSQDSVQHVPYVNGIRWNKRFKRVQRLLSGTRLHKYTPVSYEIQDDGVLISMEGRLSGVPLDILTTTRRHKNAYRTIYQQNVFEVLPTYSKRLQVWYVESVDERCKTSSVFDAINRRLKRCMLSRFKPEDIKPFEPEPVLGLGFKEPPELLNVNITLQEDMLTEYTWPFLLRVHLFYGFYKCQRKYNFKLNSVLGWDLAGQGANTLEENEYDDEDEEGNRDDEQGNGEYDSYMENPTQHAEEASTAPTAQSDDEEEDEIDEDDEEVEGVKTGRRRGWGNNRYSPHYEFELEWTPDPERISKLFQGTISSEAIKVIMEKLKIGSYWELDVKDRLVVLHWLSEVFTYHPDSKRFIDMRNEEFHTLKSGLTRTEAPSAQTMALSDVQPSDSDKIMESDNNAVSESNNLFDTLDNEEEPVKHEKRKEKKVKGILRVVLDPSKREEGEANAITSNTSEADSENTLQAPQDESNAQPSQNTDVVKRRKPKEILREVAELEERYAQRSVHLGRDRFYNDYYYFGPDLGCRIYVRVLPIPKFTAQRSSVRSKLLRLPSFGPEKFKFDISQYVRSLEEGRLFEPLQKRGRYKKNSTNETVTQETEQSQPVGFSADAEKSQSQAPSEPTNGASQAKEKNILMVKRRKQKGRRPKMTKPRLRRSREFFERQPTNFENVYEYLHSLKTIPPRICWSVMQSPKMVRMFIDRLSPLTVNERHLQQKLLQLEPELNYIAEVPEAPVECWRAPTPYGQLLLSLIRGVWSYSSTLHDYLESMLLRYKDIEIENMDNRLDEIRLINMRLVHFVEESARNVFELCCGDLDSNVKATMTITEIIVLCEFLISNYCDWSHWSDLRSMWRSEIDSIYLELQSMKKVKLEDIGSSAFDLDNCACKRRNASTSLSQNERELLKIIEELGVWFRYVHVFHKERRVLFMNYKTPFTILQGVSKPTEVYKHISALKKGSLVYLFGGYRDWLLSLREHTNFPEELYTEMLSEFGTMPLNSSFLTLISAADSLVPVVPTETLEVRIETVWFFNVPQHGYMVRLCLCSEKYDSLESSTEPDACVDGNFIPFLHSLSGNESAASINEASMTQEVATQRTYRESQRFVVYAPLELLRDCSEFLIPVTYMAEHFTHIWKPKDKCVFRKRSAKIINAAYNAADLWNMLQIDVGGTEEVGNLWEVSTP